MDIVPIKVVIKKTSKQLNSANIDSLPILLSLSETSNLINVLYSN